MAEITLKVVNKTDNAVLLRDDENGVEDWIPVSLIDDGECDPEYLEKGQEMDFSIPSWILEKKGFL